MNREDFMKELKLGLKSADYGTVCEIINDYEEYFAHGVLEGKSEMEICRELGTPQQIIENLIDQGVLKKSVFVSEKIINVNKESENYDLEKKYNIAGIVGLVILNFFLITVVILPIGGTILGIGVGFTLAIIPTLIGGLISLFTGQILAFLIVISISAFMLIILIGIYFLIKWIIKVGKVYIEWNIEIARR